MVDEKSAFEGQRATWRLAIGLTILLAAGSAFSGDSDDTPIALRFEPGVKGSPLAPRYSPKGYRVALRTTDRKVPGGSEALEGRLLLGPEDVRGDGHLLVLARSEAEAPYDRLWIDTDGDGALEDEETRTAEPRTTRGTIYTSYDAVLQVRHDAGEETALEPYPIGMWVAVESAEVTPPFIRFSRRGFLVGAATIGEVAVQIVLSDANNDAVYGVGDWWSILREGNSNDIAASRKVGDFGWVDRSAFHLELEGTRGRVGRLVAFDPGLTPEEDARARDRYWDDKHAERAEKPVAFEHDVEAAIAAAAEKGLPYFLDFETVWCGPCKIMDRLVYTAKVVVAAAEGVVCIKVDGDERKDLKERHAVSGFPTGSLFRADGEEIARFSGYQSVADMVAFFAQAGDVAEGEE